MEKLKEYLKIAKVKNYCLPGFKALAEQYGLTEEQVKKCINEIYNL